MICLEVSLEFDQIFFESLVGFYNFPLFLGVDASVMIVHSVFLHEEGNDEGRASRHAHLAVNQDIMFSQHRFNVRVSIVKMGVDVCFFIILQINPLAVFYLIIFNLLLDAVALVGPFVDDAQHAINLQLFN
jgi:hypothetical protein